jgi:hypothetical protein
MAECVFGGCLRIINGNVGEGQAHNFAHSLDVLVNQGRQSGPSGSTEKPSARSCRLCIHEPSGQKNIGKRIKVVVMTTPRAVRLLRSLGF